MLLARVFFVYRHGAICGHLDMKPFVNINIWIYRELCVESSIHKTEKCRNFISFRVLGVFAW